LSICSYNWISSHSVKMGLILHGLNTAPHLLTYYKLYLLTHLLTNSIIVHMDASVMAIFPVILGNSAISLIPGVQSVQMPFLMSTADSPTHSPTDSQQKRLSSLRMVPRRYYTHEDGTQTLLYSWRWYPGAIILMKMVPRRYYTHEDGTQALLYSWRWYPGAIILMKMVSRRYYTAVEWIQFLTLNLVHASCNRTN